jgi:phosphotransferase system HPr-like phosphotransfer protein
MLVPRPPCNPCRAVRCVVDVLKDGQVISARSIMGLMMLGAAWR